MYVKYIAQEYLPLRLLFLVEQSSSSEVRKVPAVALTIRSEMEIHTDQAESTTRHDNSQDGGHARKHLTGAPHHGASRLRH